MYIVELFSTRLPKILRAAWIQHCLMEHNPLLLPAIMNTLAYRNSITHVFSYSSLDGVYYSRFGLIRYAPLNSILPVRTFKERIIVNIWFYGIAWSFA
ncbi:MAG: hypothetical protein QXY40_07420 [Candidatus Methanomethylicia archaeon]